MLVRSPLDAGPGLVALAVADTLDLVEASDRVADMAGVVERLLALLGKGELVLVEAVALLVAEFSHQVLLPPRTTSRRLSGDMKKSPDAGRKGASGGIGALVGGASEGQGRRPTARRRGGRSRLAPG